MKVLVTGANGYVGQGVVEELVKRNVVTVATDFELSHVNQEAILKATDLFALEDPFEFYEKPDVVIHLAWRDGFKHNSINHINDLAAHYAFLEKMIDSGVKQVCVMGSMHEIGFFEGSIDEHTACRPQSLYGIAKNALRQAVELKAKEKNVKFQWLRGYYIVGNSHYGCSIFSKITAAAEKGETEFPFTLGQNQFDFIDYDEFCAQIVTAALQDKVLGIINCCSGKPEKLADRVERFIQDNNYNIKLKYGAFPDRSYDSKAVWGHNEKITKIMNAGQ